MCNTQRTFGQLVGLDPTVRVAPHCDDLVVCEDTREEKRREDCVEADDGTFWADADAFAICPDCDSAKDAAEIEDNNGRCESCDQDYTDCESCNEHIRRDDAIHEDNRDWCESCHSEEFTCCEDCNETIRSRDAECVNSTTLCNSCYCDNYFTCDGCNESFHNDNRYGDDDGTYCEDCMPRSESTEMPIGRAVCSDRANECRSNRKFGVELETHSCGTYSDWLRPTGWGAKTDGSIQGMEFVSPPLSGDDGLASVRQVTGYMDSSEWEVNRSCGFHLHCDLSDTTPAQRKAIALAYCYTSEVWESFTASHRHDNNYCCKNTGSRHYGNDRPQYKWDRDSINAGNGHPVPSTRYIWLNWCAFDEHGTVEVRSHEGTIDGTAVCNWVKAHLRFIDFIAKLSPGQVTRIFGGRTKEAMFTELTKMWDDSALTDYYGRKSGLRPAAPAVPTESEECAVAVG